MFGSYFILYFFFVLVILMLLGVFEDRIGYYEGRDSDLGIKFMYTLIGSRRVPFVWAHRAIP